MFNTFDRQLDDLYIMGSEDITDNKYYNEDYEYFAPLFISKNSLPNYFIIFRIDGTGLENINSTNFRTEILGKLKCIKIVDLTTNTEIGQWLYNNITNNPQFPLTSFEMDFRTLQFSHWNGIDLDYGGYGKKSYFFDQILEYENTFNDLEKFIYDGFKNNNIAYPNILNFSFLFNDTPATPNSLRPWSLNRYSGFYLEDMIISKSVSTYLPSIIANDVIILPGNIITNTFNKPFSDSTLKLNNIYVEYLGNFYNVAKNIFNNVIQWTIISNIDLSGQQGLLNQNIINIDSNNKITYLNGNSLIIDDWDTADVWLMKIGNMYHTLQNNNGDYYLYTDYGFTINGNILNYFINYPNPTYSTYIDVSNGKTWIGNNIIVNSSTSSTPVSFPIYKCVFSDVKYFDESIIDTEFSKFEYDTTSDVIQTDESKMYLTNLSDTNNPKGKVDFLINNIPANIPASSHYTANGETFRILNNGFTQDLNNLWRKNIEYEKWGFKNSLSANDYPYLLNNSFLGEDFNKTANVFLYSPSIIDRNLDYFYTINSSTISYIWHSLHIEDINNNVINATYSFDIAQYLNLSYDYFTSFFDRKVYLNNSTCITNVSKFSYFNSGDSNIPNMTLFRGMKINIYDVKSVKIIDNQFKNINLSNNNTYDNYKLSILLSQNNLTVETNNINVNQLSITNSNNQLEWYIVDFWKYDKNYYTNDYVNYMDILFIALTNSYTSDPNVNPSNDNISWTYSSIDTLFWSPARTYMTYISGSLSNVVFNSGEYYYYNGISTNTFYNPAIVYNYSDYVLYNNSVWISNTGSNTYQPNVSSIWRDSNYNPYTYWSIVNNDSYLMGWTLINLWNP